MSVAAALAEAHHSFPKGGWSEAYKAPRGPKTASAHVEPASFQLCDEEDVGRGRPPCLGELAGKPERMQQGTVAVPMLDGPVPLMVDQLVDVLMIIDRSVPVVAEQVTEVPKIILQDGIPPRTVLRSEQMAEQLVEVPTVAFLSSRPLTFQFRVVELIFEEIQRSAEQNIKASKVFSKNRALRRLMEQYVPVSTVLPRTVFNSVSWS